MNRIVAPTAAQVERAGQALRRGELVIIPTETVYGVAADALNPDAVKKIFAAKGRPSDNPLIVHVLNADQARTLVIEWTETAQVLSERFWPGPLTLVMKKAPHVPDVVTAGLDTVAIRMPHHSVAIEVIQATGVPLAAPSANRFMELSPTRVEHIDERLLNSVALVLDGGPCRVGVESTVVDLSEGDVRLLRPGGVSRAEVEAALKRSLSSTPFSGGRRSPGMYARHYAPRAKLEMVDVLEPLQTGLTFDEATKNQIRMPLDPAAYAASLYDALHRLDGAGVETIYVEWPPDDPDWEAVHDRLKKARALEPKSS